MIAHRLRPFDPLQWLRKTAPIELKLTIAFTLSSMLTCISLLLGWWAFGRVWEVTGSHRAELEPVRDALAASRFLLMAAAIGLSYLFGRIIAVPSITVVRRMETLAQGDLDAPIPFVMQGDCVGRIAKAMQVFRNTALAEHETAERSRLQAADLRVANAKLKQLAQDL